MEHDGNDKEGAQQNDGVEDEGEDGVSAGRGLFDIKYHTLNAIGKGAFGFVKLARRKIDEEEVHVYHFRISSNLIFFFFYTLSEKQIRAVTPLKF